MIGVYDFCGHYEWTFSWLDREGGHELVRDYWNEAINHDSQRHARDLILSKGIDGMKEYWGVTLEDEGGTHHCTATDEVFRIDMHECPSKGFLIRNGLAQYRDYCDHCIGWIGPLTKDAGFVIDHEHNHCGQCWWEMRRKEDARPASDAGEVSGAHDVRLRNDWPSARSLDKFIRATSPDDKTAVSQ